MTIVPTWQLRARFAAALSTMYGREVPAYTNLVDACADINASVVAARSDAQRFGDLDRVTAERHGAIRVGTPQELHQVGTIFAGFGMYPVGFYDLRDAAQSAVPVVSTAFRPIDEDELAHNPFRVFTSMLTVDDRRFFSADLQSRIREFLGRRTLFSVELITMATRAIEGNGLPPIEADVFVRLATSAFELSSEPTDRAWYSELETVSAVAADIGGVGTTHINHLTPRVLDIDELYSRMQQQGLTMIDQIQGPPRWNGPDVLLRQTSFRALAEPRKFRDPDGSVVDGTLRVRFGEVESRGIALTPQGRAFYDTLMAEIDMTEHRDSSWQDTARAVWDSSDFPTTEAGLREQELAYFTYQVNENSDRSNLQGLELTDLVRSGTLTATPIVYEDFLPRSAAGIFQSNLSGNGTKDSATTGADYSIDWFAGALEREVNLPASLYDMQQTTSIRKCLSELGIDASCRPATNLT